MKAVFTTPSFEFIMYVPDSAPPRYSIFMPAGIELLNLLEEAVPWQKMPEGVILHFDRDSDGVYRYTGFTR